MATNGKAGVLDTLAPVTSDADDQIALERPYVARVTIEGTAALLFHRWSVESVEEKANAAKGSKAKKSDDIESYVYRDEQGHICLPGEYLRQSVIEAARYKQDPRSPRKSARDLFKAGVAALTELASLGSKQWDYLDRRRAMVQRQGITRTRPAFSAGWRATVDLQILLPAYIPPALLRDTLIDAGRLVGTGDHRPTYGRYDLVGWEILPR